MIALIAKEFQTWLQSRAIFLLVGLVILAVGLSAFLLGLLVLLPHPGALPSLFGASAPPSGANASDVLPSALVPYRPVFLFGAGTISMLLVIIFIAPALAATAFGAERAAGTLDLLLLHAGRAERVTAAKIAAATLFLALLLLAGLPSVAPAWMVGGIDVGLVIASFAILLSALVLACALGVLFSALVADSLAAAFMAQTLMLGLAVLTPAIYAAARVVVGPTPGPPNALLWLSPIVVLLDAGGDATKTLLGLAPPPVRAALTPPGALPALFGLALPGWIPAVVLWLALAAACWLAASVALDPCHPLRRRRPGSAPDNRQPGEETALAGLRARLAGWRRAEAGAGGSEPTA